MKGAMKMETRKFPLRVVLTVTTGRLLTQSNGPRDNGIGDLYDILGWMTNDSPFTHQLPRFAEECSPRLLEWFPELKEVEAHLDSLDTWMNKSASTQDGVEGWLSNLPTLVPALRADYDIPRIADHIARDPAEKTVVVAP
jgi:hypothetical protein